MVTEKEVFDAAMDYLTAFDSGEDAWDNDTEMETGLLSSIEGPRFPAREAAHKKLLELMRTYNKEHGFTNEKD